MGAFSIFVLQELFFIWQRYKSELCCEHKIAQAVNDINIYRLSNEDTSPIVENGIKKKFMNAIMNFIF